MVTVHCSCKRGHVTKESKKYGKTASGMECTVAEYKGGKMVKAERGSCSIWMEKSEKR